MSSKKGTPLDGLCPNFGAEDPQLPFVGRDATRATIERELHRANAGQRSVLFIEGQAGIGKSRVLDLGVTMAGALGFRQCRGSAEELGRNRPFGVVIDVLGVTGAAPKLRTSDPHSTLNDIVGLVRAMSSERPLVLALDDMHWTDDYSLLALQSLARGLPDLPLAVLLAFRPLMPGSSQERLLRGFRRHGAVHIHLGPLDDQSATILATAAARTELGDGMLPILEAAEGNPRAAIEAARHCTASALSSTTSHGAAICRQAALPDNTIELLTLSSVLGSPFEVHHLSSVAARPICDLLGPLEEAVRWGILKEEGARLAFRHEVVRQALYERLPCALRRALHLHFAWCLADSGASAIAVSEHFAQGALVGDLQALRWLSRAAQDAMLRAPGEAADLLKCALLLTDPTDANCAALIVELCDALRLSGRISEAKRVAHRALARQHCPETEFGLRGALITALIDEGNAAEAQREACVAMRDLEGSTGVTPSIVAAVACGQLLAGDLEGASRLADRAKAMAEPLSDDLSLCRAEDVSCTVATLQGRTREAVALGRRLADRAKRCARARMSLPSVSLALALTDADDLTAAKQGLISAMGTADTLGVPGNRLRYYLCLAKIRYLSGEWTAAVADAEAALRVAHEMDCHRGIVVAHAVRAFVALRRNDLSTGESHVLSGERHLASSTPEFCASWVRWARGYLEEAHGNEEGALVAYEKAWRLSVDFGAHCEHPLLGPDLVRVLVRRGNTERAALFAGEIEVVARRMRVAWAEGAGLRARGLADGDADMLLKAVAAERHSLRSVQRATGAEEAAVMLIQAGHMSEAARLMKEALTMYEALDAKRDAARTRAALRRLGVRCDAPRSDGDRAKRAASEGWDSLTASEIRVVHLIGEGLSYRQAAAQLFISPRTVETHISHAFAKLHCTSRSELRAELARRRPAERTQAPPPSERNPDARDIPAVHSF